MTRLAFIGGGNMARSLIGGLLKTGVAPATLSVAEPLAEARQALGRDFGVACYAENRLAVADAEVILLAVKPQVMPAIHADLRDTLQRNRPLLSRSLPACGWTRWSAGSAAACRSCAACRTRRR